MEFCYANNPNSLFRKYAKLVMWFANTQLGRDYLGIPKDVPPLMLLTENTYHFLVSLKKKNGLFIPTLTAVSILNNPFGEKLDYALASLDCIAAKIKGFHQAQEALLHYLYLIFRPNTYPRFLFDSYDQRATTDITIWDGGSDSTSTTFSVGENPSGAQVYRHLQKFDLSSIPAGSIVSANTLTWTILDSPALNSRTCNIYRMLRNWTTGATWATYDGTNAWTTAGFSGEGTDRTASIGSWTTNINWIENDTVSVSLTNSEVENMINTNYGIGAYHTVEADDLINYKSAANADTTKRPRLQITYTPPAGGLLLAQEI